MNSSKAQSDGSYFTVWRWKVFQFQVALLKKIQIPQKALLKKIWIPQKVRLIVFTICLRWQVFHQSPRSSVEENMNSSNAQSHLYSHCLRSMSMSLSPHDGLLKKSIHREQPTFYPKNRNEKIVDSKSESLTPKNVHRSGFRQYPNSLSIYRTHLPL